MSAVVLICCVIAVSCGVAAVALARRSPDATLKRTLRSQAAELKALQQRVTGVEQATKKLQGFDARRIAADRDLAKTVGEIFNGNPAPKQRGNHLQLVRNEPDEPTTDSSTTPVPRRRTGWMEQHPGIAAIGGTAASIGVLLATPLQPVDAVDQDDQPPPQAAGPTVEDSGPPTTIGDEATARSATVRITRSSSRPADMPWAKHARQPSPVPTQRASSTPALPVQGTPRSARERCISPSTTAQTDAVDQVVDSLPTVPDVLDRVTPIVPGLLNQLAPPGRE